MVNRSIPAHNNRAERELRPLVIARKSSFGSQSDKGAATRSVLQSIVTTAAKRLSDVSLKKWLVDCLTQFAKNTDIDPHSLIPAS